MARYLTAMTCLCIVTLITGCGTSPFGTALDPKKGTQITLTSTSYEEAFATGTEIMQKYFPPADANTSTRMIYGAPTAAKLGAERLLGGKSPARRIATMSLQKKGDNVIARLTVVIQRQGSASFQRMTPADDYSTVPNQSPAQGTAATTASQNEAWQTQKYDHGMERKILTELKQALK